VTIEGGFDYNFPKMAKVKQIFPNPVLGNVEQTIHDNIKPFLKDCRGKHIAITAGSRGINGILGILHSVINELKSVEAKPFIVAAMGSHGGATEAGQRELLECYGLTEENLGVPVVYSMDADYIGQTLSGVKVYCQHDALNADGIIVINKIKPHADFKGPIESGLCKMMVVGLGKHKGASEIHSYGFDRMSELLPQTAEVFLEKAPVQFGIGILENAYDQLMDLPFVNASEILTKEPELLYRSKQNIAKIQLSKVDVMIIEQIGKDISGEGMDPNVTGRPGSFLQEGFDAPSIKQIVVLGVTPASHGNGVGIGMADISTVKCMRQLDLGLIYTNAITSTLLGPAKLPVIFNNDKEAISAAVRLCHRVKMQDARIVRIKSTLHLDEIYVSEAYADEISISPSLKQMTDFQNILFNESGDII
ncbi:MAG TPA: lactate racemase domain-containing protein, partial [Syntrophomonas sp.]|nr:lactate racemase domain-containing protein [Syntrophomonas sp.]